MYRSNLLTIFYLFMCLLPGLAQEYSYARYDVKDGLAGSVVYHGVEDQEGFLWLATETGVSRFDGTHFRNFTKADGLPDNEILRLFVDSKNRVWMMPFRSSICYYWKGKIYNQENDPLLKKILINERISNILEDRQGNLLLRDYSALFFISADGNIKVIKDFGGTTFAAGSAFLTTTGNFSIQLQLGQRPNPGPSFIVEYDPKGAIIGQKPFYYAPWGDNFSISTPHMEIYRLGDSLIVTTTTDQNKKAIALPPAFNSLSLINDTLCSINTGNGALFYDTRAGKVVRHVLPGKNVNSVFQDKEGNSWFLTAGVGIFRVGSFEFTNFTFTENKIDHLGVFSIAQFDPILYVGTEKSLLYTIDRGKKTILAHHVSNYSINNKISAIVQMPSGRIMLGTNEGVIEFKGKGERSKIPFTIKSIQVDGNRLLASMQSGIVLLSEKLLHDDLMTGKRSACSYVQNKIYYNGTLNGLYTFDSTGKSTWLGEQEPLLRSRISDIEGSAEGTLWIGTHGEGLIGYKDGRIIWSIRQKDGLTSDICRTVFIAGKEVWVGTDKGLNKVVWDQGRYHITTFTSADGLMADIINAVYVDGSTVYAGTPAGLTTFDANKISLNSFCKLRMTGIQAVGRQWAKDTTGFILPPRDNAIRFDYVGISYRSAGDITYRYRLLGLNDGWQTTRETFLSYPSLPSGDYELQVKATNKFGVESNMINIPFRVEKLLWEKNWFRALVLILAAGVIWLFCGQAHKKAAQAE
jgi:ligand-binding sensor domain-containing protein